MHTDFNAQATAIMAHRSKDVSAKEIAAEYRDDVKGDMEKYKTLKDLDVFILDNSIRESTVAQLRGHTIENKWQIYEEVKSCGFKNIIVASFSHMTRVDDIFIKQLLQKGEDRNGLFAFSEITAGIKNKVPDKETVPTGLSKLKELGMWNVIFEVDFSDATYNFEKFTMDDLCQLTTKWIRWAHDNLHKNSKVLINLRDMSDVMDENPLRVFEMVEYLARLPSNIRPFGVIFEESRGTRLPEECGNWAKYIRKTMDVNGWEAHLLIHVHEKYGFADKSQLEGLLNGCNGTWGSICIEGASLGNASSCVTMLNLIRMGNKKVLKEYNCSYLRKAAIKVTEITTGKEPYIKQPIYGARALDFVFSFAKEDFDLADFFGVEAPARISTLSSNEMMQSRMIKLFGPNPQFTLKMANKMKMVMLSDLKDNRKEEYMSKVGLALLFDRSGGKLTEPMMATIEKMEVKNIHAQYLIAEIRKMWDIWDLSEDDSKDDMLEYDSFYNGFMAPYFACYRCMDTKKGLQAIDMDNDGRVSWNEFSMYLKWAVREYPKTENAEDLLDITFRMGLIPAMRDEVMA